MLKRILATLAISLPLISLSGCSTFSNVGEQAAGLFGLSEPVVTHRVAIIPFESLTDDRTVGITVSKLLYGELSSADNIQLTEESGLRNWLSTKDININQLADSTSAKKLGEALQVDRIILGSVSRYDRGVELYSESAVAISAQLVDVKTGKVLWADSRNSIGTDGFWSGKKSVEALAQEIVKEMADDIEDIR